MLWILFIRNLAIILGFICHQLNHLCIFICFLNKEFSTFFRRLMFLLENLLSITHIVPKRIIMTWLFNISTVYCISLKIYSHRMMGGSSIATCFLFFEWQLIGSNTVRNWVFRNIHFNEWTHHAFQLYLL